jgi:NADPH2:quinone reductase
MRAVVIHHFGDVKDLKVEEVPTPELRDGEALVEVRAALINPSDVKNVAGAMADTTLPRIAGRDFAGVVVGGPKDVVGLEVFGTGGDVGFTRDGSHAQFIFLPIGALTAKPARLSMEQAGSAGVAYVTAWSALVTAAGVHAGDVAVVIGAAGSVGTAAVQIAKARGARVIGAVRKEAEHAMVRANGADEVIGAQSATIVEAARSMTRGQGADVVFDTSGMMFAEAVEAAAHDGRIPIISAPHDGRVSFNLRTLYRRELRVVGVDSRHLDVTACAQLLAVMAEYFDSGQFRIQPGQARPLADAAEAYAEVAKGGTKIILLPNEDFSSRRATK